MIFHEKERPSKEYATKKEVIKQETEKVENKPNQRITIKYVKK